MKRKFSCLLCGVFLTIAALSSCQKTESEAFEVYTNMTSLSLANFSAAEYREVEKAKFILRGTGDGTGKIRLKEEGAANETGALTTSSSEKTASEKEDFSAYKQVSSLKDSAYFASFSQIVIYYDSSLAGEKTRAEEVIQKIEKRAEEIDFALNAEKEGGDISRVNSAQKGEKVEISSLAYSALKQAFEISSFTEGYFSPALRLSVDLWGFTPRFFSADGEKNILPYDRENFLKELPEEKYISAFRSLQSAGAGTFEEVGEKFFFLKNNSSVEIDGVEYTPQIDLGGFGKGFAADEAFAIMKSEGFPFGFVNFGGSSFYFNKMPRESIAGGEKYDIKVSLRYPTEEGSRLNLSYASLFTHDCGLSTSGDYERFYEINGEKYCHILNPETGAPIQTGMVTATVLGGSAAENDALSTALLAMGKEKALSFVNEKLTEKKVVFVCRKGGGK